jgi:hypothetical protein
MLHSFSPYSGGRLFLIIVLKNFGAVLICTTFSTYRSIFGFPSKAGDEEGMMCKTGRKTFRNKSCCVALPDFRRCPCSFPNHPGIYYKRKGNCPGERGDTRGGLLNQGG